MEAAAPITPGVPSGAKGWKFSILMTGTASQMKADSATSFTATSTALTVALSRVPIASRAVTVNAISTASTLTTPPA